MTELFLTSLLLVGRGWFANHALQRRQALRAPLPINLNAAFTSHLPLAAVAELGR